MMLAPKDTLEKARQSLAEANKTASELVNMFYNMYMLKVLPQALLGQQVNQGMLMPTVQEKKDDVTEQVRQAYIDAIKIKAFQSVLGPQQQPEQPSQQVQKEEREEEDEDILAREFAKMFTDLARKDPDKAKALLQSLTEQDIQKLSLLANLSGKPNPLVPLLALVKSGNEEKKSNEGSIVDMAKAMADMLKTGVEIGKAQSQPQQQTGDSLINTLLNALINHLLKEKDEETKNLLGQVYTALEKKENIYEKILTDKEFRDSLRNFFSKEGVPSELNTELEKLKLDLERFKTEKALEIQRWQAEKDWEIKRQENLVKTLETVFQGPPGKLIDSAISKAIGGVGKGVAAQTATQAAKMINAKCGECGAVFQVAEGLKTVKCPSCGAELEMP
jgi:ribosomal protein S27E